MVKITFISRRHLFPLSLSIYIYIYTYNLFLAGGAVEEFSSIISIVISVSNERSEGAYARNETRHIIGALFSVVKEDEEEGER